MECNRPTRGSPPAKKHSPPRAKKDSSPRAKKRLPIKTVLATLCGGLLAATWCVAYKTIQSATGQQALEAGRKLPDHNDEQALCRGIVDVVDGAEIGARLSPDIVQSLHICAEHGDPGAKALLADIDTLDLSTLECAGQDVDSFCQGDFVIVRVRGGSGSRSDSSSEATISTAELSPDSSFSLSDDSNDDDGGGKPRSLAEHDALESNTEPSLDASFALSSDDIGRTVFAAATANSFFDPYFEQEIALSEEEFAKDIAPRFTPSFLSYAVSTNRPPASCIPPSQFKSFFHEDSRQPGSYSSAIYVRHNDLVDFRDGNIEFPPGFNEKYKRDLRTVAVETIKVADEHHTNPSVTNPLVAMIYNGLTSYNVVYNPDAENDDKARKGRMQEHLAGGSSKSLHSAGIALFIQSRLFQDSQHLYGLTATAEYGDVATTAGLEVFESAALVSSGRGWSSTYGETFNKVCVGLVSDREDREEQLWQTVSRLRGLFGDAIPLTDRHVPGHLAFLARNSVLTEYVFQTHNRLRKGVDDPASITLKEFSSTITAHATAVRFGLELDNDRAAALVASDIPREDLLLALNYETAIPLNKLIKKHSVAGCKTFGAWAVSSGSKSYKRVGKLVLEALNEEDTRPENAKVAREQSDERRAQALVNSIPRKELVEALQNRGATALNKLIDKCSVDGCQKFGTNIKAGGPYERVKELVLEKLGEAATTLMQEVAEEMAEEVPLAAAAAVDITPPSPPPLEAEAQTETTSPAAIEAAGAATAEVNNAYATAGVASVGSYMHPGTYSVAGFWHPHPYTQMAHPYPYYYYPPNHHQQAVEAAAAAYLAQYRQHQPHHQQVALASEAALKQEVTEEVTWEMTDSSSDTEGDAVTEPGKNDVDQTYAKYREKRDAKLISSGEAITTKSGKIKKRRVEYTHAEVKVIKRLCVEQWGLSNGCYHPPTSYNWNAVTSHKDVDSNRSSRTLANKIKALLTKDNIDFKNGHPKEAFENYRRTLEDSSE